MRKTFLGLGLFLAFSCNVEGEERLDYYKNQNRSFELMGWWKQINDVENKDNPHHYNFTNFKLFSYYYNIHTGKYGQSFDYWYNDGTNIYLLDAPSPTGGVNESRHPYAFNDTKDTLTVYISNNSYIYVKSQGL
jgi:hypothetical protein